MSENANRPRDGGAARSGFPYAPPYREPERPRPTSQVPVGGHVLFALVGALVAGYGLMLVAAAFNAPASAGNSEPYGLVFGPPLVVVGLVQLGISVGLVVRRIRRRWRPDQR